MRYALLLLAFAVSACADDVPGPPADAPAPEASLDTAATDLSGVAVGQALYVPAYSHVYTGDRMQPVDLTATLSIRNTDARTAISLTRVRYAGTDGSILRSELDAPRTLGPLASVEFTVDESDREGGSGASFLVEWTAEAPVSAPVVEAVMISTAGQQGISFVTEGRVTDSVGL